MLLIPLKTYTFITGTSSLSFFQAPPSETLPYITENSLHYIITVNCKFIKKIYNAL